MLKLPALTALLLTGWFNLPATAQPAPVSPAPTPCVGSENCQPQPRTRQPFNRGDYATRADFEALIQRQRELLQELRQLNNRVGSLAGEETPPSRTPPAPRTMPSPQD